MSTEGAPPDASARQAMQAARARSANNVHRCVLACFGNQDCCLTVFLEDDPGMHKLIIGLEA